MIVKERKIIQKAVVVWTLLNKKTSGSLPYAQKDLMDAVGDLMAHRNKAAGRTK